MDLHLLGRMTARQQEAYLLRLTAPPETKPEKEEDSNEEEDGAEATRQQPEPTPRDKPPAMVCSSASHRGWR